MKAKDVVCILIAMLLLLLVQLRVRAYECDRELKGWAAEDGCTLGGGDSNPIIVSSLIAFVETAGDTTTRVIIVSGTINTGAYPVKIASNKTVKGASKDAAIRGGLLIRDAQNVVVRDLRIEGAWPTKNPENCIKVVGSHHVWLNHLEIYNAPAGNLDIQDADYITVSWCKFSFTNSSIKERVGAVIGGVDFGYKFALRSTWHHNWFADLIATDMPSYYQGHGHVYNNYYTSEDNVYCFGIGLAASVLIEYNYFKRVKDAHVFLDDSQALIVARGNVYEDCTGQMDNSTSTHGSQRPDYKYRLDYAEYVPFLVTTLAGVPDPCNGVECGSHGQCASGKCQCTDGYTGTRCENVPTSTVSPPQCDITVTDAGSSSVLVAYNVQASDPLSTLYVAAVRAYVGSGFHYMLSGPKQWSPTMRSVFTADISATLPTPKILGVIDSKNVQTFVSIEQITSGGGTYTFACPKDVSLPPIFVPTAGVI